MSEVLQFPAHAEPAVDLSDVVQEVCAALETQGLRRQVELEVDVPPYTMVSGDRERFRRLLELLVTTVLESTPPGRSVVVIGSNGETAVELEVADCRAVLAPRRPVETTEATGRADELRQLTAGCGAELRMTQGAGGGLAWTLRLPRRPGAENDSRQAA
jgi:light-regulated signal transduction histidine kinase (bacteriophytochrome)